MNKEFIVLGLYEIHCASAALMINGEVVAASHEERFSRIKGDVSFPLKAAEYCLKQAGIKPSDVDQVAILNDSFNHNGMANIMFKRQALYGIDDWIEENEKYWRPVLVEGKQIQSYFDLMGGWDRVQDHHYDFSKIDMNADAKTLNETFKEIRLDTVEKCLGISKDKVHFAPHYLMHHYHAYYSSPYRGDNVVNLHLEGDGGIFNSAITIPTPEGLKVLGGSNNADIGRLYQWTTLSLGMKPYSHEYKLMGLAPYATEYEVQKTMKVYENIFKVDEKKQCITYNEKPSDLYFHFQDALKGHRFDGIAGALQRTLEKHVCDWVDQVVKSTGRNQICYGGGVAMNVKANMEICKMDNVQSLFVPVSPADESNAIGACYWLHEKHLIEKGVDPSCIPALRTPYLGQEFSSQDALSAIKDHDFTHDYHVYEDITNKQLAKLLHSGKTLSTCRGRAEFGQRALGNRSILAHPSIEGIVQKINHQIKYRDFWMPFCPSILDENHRDYVENPKELGSDYMTIGFPVQEKALHLMRNVMHSGDQTARPQLLKEQNNPEYVDLIREFRDLSDIGVLLNTSFNLHGEPVVNGPADALSTFSRSDLDAVVMDKVLVTKAPLDQ